MNGLMRILMVLFALIAAYLWVWPQLHPVPPKPKPQPVAAQVRLIDAESGVELAGDVVKPDEVRPAPTEPPATQQEMPPLAEPGQASVEPAPQESPVVDQLSVSKPEVEPEVRVLIGHDAASKEQLDADLELAIEESQWVEYGAILQRSLKHAGADFESGSELDPYAPVWDEARYYQAMLRWKLLQVFPPSCWVATFEESSTRDLPRWLFNDNRAMEEVLLTVRPEDDVTVVLPMLDMLWCMHDEPSTMGPKYFNLALACSVVFDHKIRYKNQSGDGDRSVYVGDRFQWYVEQNEGGLLEVSIDRSRARDLVFVVCAPVREKELHWALRKYRSMRRAAWGKTYGEVKYLMERAVEGLNPYEEYSLEEILKEGGICGDQTYFCVNTARAAGIPAIGLSGVTDAGGHAWAALMVKPDEWTTGVGRISGVSQGKGRDPQTGKMITEQEIWMWSSREYQSDSRVLKVGRHLWLADVFWQTGNEAGQAEAIRVAHRYGRAFPDVWERLYQVMKQDSKRVDEPEAPSTVDEWREFSAGIKREFKENPRMAALASRVEDEHVFPYQDLNEVRRQLSRDRRRQQRNAQEQVDLVTSSLKREAAILLQKAPDSALREISQLYDSALREYGGSISGFETMADDYFKFMRADEALAPKAVRDIELAFKRVVDSGSTDWFRAKAEVGLHRKICKMYREVGEDKRASVMERRLERQMEKAKRDAL